MPREAGSIHRPMHRPSVSQWIGPTGSGGRGAPHKDRRGGKLVAAPLRPASARLESETSPAPPSRHRDAATCPAPARRAGRAGAWSPRPSPARPAGPPVVIVRSSWVLPPGWPSAHLRGLRGQRPGLPPGLRTPAPRGGFLVRFSLSALVNSRGWESPLQMQTCLGGGLGSSPPSA